MKRNTCPRCGLEEGFVIRDGVVLDNRDGFYDNVPDPIRTYDSRTRYVMVRGEARLIEEFLQPGDFTRTDPPEPSERTA